MDILNPKTPKMPKRVGRAPKYNLDWYMTMAKNVVEKGMSYRQAAKVYGMSHGSVAHWKKVYLQGKFPKMKAALSISPETKHLHLETQIRNLKQEIADLYLENLMLKKCQPILNKRKKRIHQSSPRRIWISIESV